MNMNDERMLKKAVVAYFQVLRQYTFRGIEESHEEPRPGYPVSRPRSEPEASRIQSRRANHSTATLGQQWRKKEAKTEEIDKKEFREEHREK
jgi:hypothetical protein